MNNLLKWNQSLNLVTMYLIYKQYFFFLLGGVKVAFFCFKQLPLNDKQKFESHYQLIDAEWLLLVVVGVVRV